MSRGLGTLQREIKEILDRAVDHKIPGTFAVLRGVHSMNLGGGPEDRSEAQERSLKRALKGLVDRGDVVIVTGAGRSGSPYVYATVEKLASFFCDEVKDTAHAKQVYAEVDAQARAFLAGRQHNSPIG
jgi:hypothetical protein